MQADLYALGKAKLQHRAYGASLIVLMLKLGSGAGSRALAPCFALSSSLLGSSGSWSFNAFPKVSCPQVLHVHCSNTRWLLAGPTEVFWAQVMWVLPVSGCPVSWSAVFAAGRVSYRQSVAREPAISVLGCGIHLVLVWLPARKLPLMPFHRSKHCSFLF